MLYFFTKIITMMPGENHSKLPEIASDATAGICQNCTILHQNLKEYVAALLTLKGKIFDTDRLLTEYQEKCNDILYTSEISKGNQ
ncbi:hypothetical protein AGOR_G00113710 [Albula goreensis]|uniref:Uncharacterized protein n=1 Tax=Albula goreensis TaxID=1534307 RepID=A0A8T3DAD5_9TELE|nr:hypothetical protein AGOR_G00113710 [Albula goreensis]